MRLELGTPVRCTDDSLGELMDVVIDPTSKRLTHLVVRVRGKVGPARLVPIGLVTSTAESDVCLGCSFDEASRLDPVQDFAFLRFGEFPIDDPDWDVGIEHALAMPYYRTSDLSGDPYAYEDPVGISFDRVPKGEVEIRRSSTVVASDGHVVGRVDGFVVAEDDQISHILLDCGHLWRRRQLTIPIGAVKKVETDSVTISLTRRELKKLPTVRPAHRH